MIKKWSRIYQILKLYQFHEKRFFYGGKDVGNSSIKNCINLNSTTQILQKVVVVVAVHQRCIYTYIKFASGFKHLAFILFITFKASLCDVHKKAIIYNIGKMQRWQRKSNLRKINLIKKKIMHQKLRHWQDTCYYLKCTWISRIPMFTIKLPKCRFYYLLNPHIC